MNFEEKLIERLKRVEREVERLRVWERPAGGGGATDHGALTGLSDDDHPQYLLTTGTAADSDKLDGLDSTAFAAAGHDHDADYLGITAKAADSDKLDGKDITQLAPASHNHDADYLGITAKASDSDKLDNIDSTGFVQTSGDQTVGGIKTFTSIPALPATNPTTANQAVRKGFADATYLGITAKAADSDKLDGLDSTDFGRPVFLTTPLTSTSWDGDTKGTGDRATVDLSAVFGVPAGVKAVLMSIQTTDDTAEQYIRFGPNSTYNFTLTCRTQVANQTANVSGIVPCDANGDVYCYPSNDYILGVYVWIWGYWL